MTPAGIGTLMRLGCMEDEKNLCAEYVMTGIDDPTKILIATSKAKSEEIGADGEYEIRNRCQLLSASPEAHPSAKVWTYFA